MSADNGVFVLQSQGLCEHEEFRVAHRLGFVNSMLEDDDALKEIFGKSPVFKIFSESLEYAQNMADDFYPVEYGIIDLKINRGFPS